MNKHHCYFATSFASMEVLRSCDPFEGEPFEWLPSEQLHWLVPGSTGVLFDEAVSRPTVCVRSWCWPRPPAKASAGSDLPR